MNRRVLRGLIVALLMFALLAAGCGAAAGTGAGSGKGGAGAAGKAGPVKTGQTQAVLKTETGASVQKEVEGLDKDLNSIAPATPVDPDAEAASF